MKFKKITSLLLTFVMVLNLIPVTAFANTDVPTPFDGIISVYCDPTSESADFSSDAGSIEFSTMFPVNNAAEYWVGFSGEGAVSFSDANITPDSNNRYKIRITEFGESSYTFTIKECDTEKTAVVKVTATEATAGDGGNDDESDTPPMTEIKMFYSADGGNNWNEYNYKNQELTPNGIEIDATKPEGTYRVKFGYTKDEPIYINGAPRHSMDSDVVGFGFTGFISGENGEPDWNKPTGFMVNAKGINGSGYYSFENNDNNFGCQIKFTVTGNPENPYTNAIVVPAQIGTQTVMVATGLSGELSNAAEGFVLESGTLTFTNTANVGSFDATVGGHLYTVVIFPDADSMTDLTEDLTLKVNTDDSVITSYLGNSTFATEEYNIVTVENGSVVDINDNYREGKFGKDVKGAYTPIYVYKTLSGSLVDFDNSYFIQQVNAYMGHTSYLIKTEIKEINGVNVLKIYPLTEYAGTSVKKNTMVLGQLTISKNDGSVINQTVSTTDEETELKGTNGFGADVWWMEVGAAETERTFYIKNGQLLSLYDAVNISTLTVHSTNSTNVKVKEFYTTNGSENAIGFKLSIANTDKFVSELVKVSFKNKKTGADEHFYIPVICRDKEETLSTTVTPDQADSLQALYDTFPGTELYLEEGEYATDLYMWRGNLKVVGLGNGAVFTGSADTTKPILTFGYEGYSNENESISKKDYFRMFTNIAVDGKNKGKTGLKVEDGIALNLMKSAPTNGMGLDYINNCDVAILSTNAANNSTVNVYGLTFKNNKVAIEVGHSLGYAVVGNHTKEILENNFMGNETDFKVTSENCVISIPQNFYADANGTMKSNGAPTVVGATNVDYMPYYTSANRDTIQAQIDTVASVAEEATKLNVPVTLMQTDLAVKLDKTLFEQINAVKGTAKYEVSVPVREKGDKINVIWNFDSTKLAATQPEATTLKVTGELSAQAQAVVDKIDSTKTTVAQTVNFSHSGNLPGETTVYVLKEGTTTIENLKLYYINTETGELELVNLNDAKVTEVTVDGAVYFAVTIDHCSEYIISTAVVIENIGNEGGEGESGTNGDTTEGGSTNSGSTESSSPSTTPAPSSTPAQTTVNPKEDVSANDFVSAVEIESKLEASSSETVKINVSDKNYVSPKAFELLAEYPDKTLVFEGEGFSISFAGADLTDPDVLGNKTFDATVSLESPNAAEIKAVAGEANIINVYFNHHGELPGKAKVRVFVGTDHAGLEKHVHYFDGTTNSFEFIQTVTVDADGWVEFTIDHCSDYVLSDILLDKAADTEGEQTPENEDVQEPVTEPSENKVSVIPFIAIIAVVAGIVIMFIRKKK